MRQNPIQKRVLTVEDLSCFGKCSSTVALPILSAMGHEAVTLPTAILSTHTGGFEGYHVRDLTEDILPISQHWLKSGIGFDCIYTGYLCKGRQVSLVRELIRRHRGEGVLLVSDPAMADNGKYYCGFDAEHGADMLTLCCEADVITPNVTEAAFLLGEQPPKDGYGVDYAKGLILRLRERGCKSVVLTSVHAEGRYGVIGYDSAKQAFFEYFHERCGRSLHGSGDVYTGVLVGKLLLGASLGAAACFAADFVREAVACTLPYAEQHPYGLIYEPLLGRLVPDFPVR